VSSAFYTVFSRPPVTPVYILLTGDLPITSEHLVAELVLARYRINILDVALPKASPDPKHLFAQKCKIYSETCLRTRLNQAAFSSLFTGVSSSKTITFLGQTSTQAPHSAHLS